MTKINSTQLYWLDLALQAFFTQVWHKGLKKFAEDTVEETAELTFLDLKIGIQPGKEENYRKVTLGNLDHEIVLSLDLNSEDGSYDMLSVDDLEAVTDLIYETIDTYQEGFFRLKEE